MEIALARERVLQLTPQVSLDEARVRVEEKKVSLVAGTFGSLFTRPKPDEILLTYSEHRLEPFWHLAVHVRNVYERQRPYVLAVSGPEVKQVTLSGQTYNADAQAKGGPSVTLTATEHCEEDRRLSRLFTGEGEPAQELARYLSGPAEEIPDLAEFQPEGVIVVPPVTRSGAVTRQVMTEVVRPIKAQVIHEEQVMIDAIDLYLRPVYAFEFQWAAKGKRVVIEWDGITGEARTGGKTLKDQIKQMLKPELLFDLSADAVELLVPGGGIAVKLAKAVVDLKKR